jgi:hypothetical protein
VNQKLNWTLHMLVCADDVNLLGTNIGTIKRRYVISWKAAGSIPDEVIELFFNLPHPSSRIMALGFTQPLTEMSSRISFCGVKHGWRVKLTVSLPSVSRLSRQCGTLDISQPYRPPRPGTGIALLSCAYLPQRKTQKL